MALYNKVGDIIFDKVTKEGIKMSKKVQKISEDYIFEGMKNIY